MKNRFLIIKVKNRFLIIKVKNRFLIIKVSFSLYKEILCLVSTFRRNNGTKICTFCHDKLYVFGMILVEKILGFYNYYNRANSSLPYGNIHSCIDKYFVFMRKKNHRKIFIWASRLWVGRRSEPILGYISKFDGKKGLWQ